MKCKQLLLLAFFPAALFSRAQVNTIGYIDIGSNQVESDVYLRTGIGADYRFKNISFDAGFLTNLKSENDLFFAGYSLKTKCDFKVRQKLFIAEAFFVQTYDEMLRETNWGADISKHWKHIDLSLGTFFKVYAYRNASIEKYNIDDDNDKISEPFNLLYSFVYRIKPKGNSWNAAIAVTNIDYYHFSQETNPLFNLNGYYNITPSLTLFTENWFEFSGIFNINANYFGYYMRCGIRIKMNEL